MKRMVLILILILTAFTEPGKAQKPVFGPHVINDGREILIDGICTPIVRSKDTASWNSIWTLIRGYDAPTHDYEIRIIADWLMPGDSTKSPQDALRATLRMEYFGDSLPDLTADVWSFSSLSNTMDDATVINAMTGSPDFSITGTNGLVEYTASSGTFLDIVNDGAAAGHLTLAFMLPDIPLLHHHVFKIDSVAIQLTVWYEADVTIKITNVIDGIEDLFLDDGQGANLSKVRDEQTNDVWQNAPYYPTWHTGINHFAETRFWEYTSIPNSPDEKFQLWDSSIDEYTVRKDVQNFDGFVNEFLAYTAEHKNTSVKSNFEFFTPSPAQAEYHDPWRVEVSGSSSDWQQTQPDQFADILTEFQPQLWNNSYGVFPEQDIQPDRPHYRLRSWKKLRWVDPQSAYAKMDVGDALQIGDGVFYGTTGVEFNDGFVMGTCFDISPLQSVEFQHEPLGNPGDDPYLVHGLKYRDDNTAVTQLYKTHRGANLEFQPTKHANQRKIDIDEYGYYHMVYESSGAIWYSMSYDGTTWSPEKCLSWGPGGDCHNPSIAVIDHDVFVTYIAYGPSDDTLVLRHTLDMVQPYVWSWQSPFNSEASFLGPVSMPIGNFRGAHPAIDVVRYPVDTPQGYMAMIAWDGEDGVFCVPAWVSLPNVEFEIGPVLTLEQTILIPPYSLNPTFPCIAAPSESADKFMVAWCAAIGFDQCVSQEVQFSRPSAGPTTVQTTFLSPLNVSDPFIEGAPYPPSMTHNMYGDYVVSYEVKNPNSLLPKYAWARYFVVKKFTQGNPSWNTTGTRGILQTNYLEAMQPTVGCRAATPPAEGIRVVYNQNWGTTLMVANLDSGFVVTSRPANGNECFASLVPYAPNGGLLDVHSVYRPDFPGTITWGLETSSVGLAKESTVQTVHMRDACIIKDSSVYQFGIHAPTIIDRYNNESALEWNSVPDSLVTGVECSIDEKLRTETFVAEPGMKLKLDCMRWRTSVNRFPQSVAYALMIKDASSNDTLTKYTFPANQIQPDTVLWSLEVVNLSALSGKSVYAAVGIEGDTSGVYQTVRKIWIEFDTFQKIRANTAQAEVLPHTIDLAQNAPNPFNPSTTITYHLPEPMEMRLAVYDMYGREIQELARGWSLAGTHVVRFDGDDLPAGVYLYRLETAHVSASRKMVLIK